jgi:hypothetical protein
MKSSLSSVENTAEQPFSRSFFDKTNATARKIYLRLFLSGCFLVIVAIFTILAIYWGSLWKTPVKNLNGWVVVSKSCFLSFLYI